MVASRRALLISGATVAAVAALGVPLATLPAASIGGLVLSEGERALVAALGDALFPPDSPLGIAAREVDLPTLVDDLVGDALDPMVAPVFRYLLRALDLGTLASRGAAFADLPLDARRDVLATWADNAVLPRRLVYDTFKTLLGMAFFDAPEVRRAMGWEASICYGGAA